VAIKASESIKSPKPKPKAIDEVRLKLNTKQLKFCELYLSGMAANRAYIDAGYNCRNANNARMLASRLLSTNDSVREYIELSKKQITKTYEINRSVLLDNLMKIALGEVHEERAVTVLVGNGCSEARLIKQKTSPRDRAKATEILLRIIAEESYTPTETEDDPITKSIKESVGK